MPFFLTICFCICALYATPRPVLDPSDSTYAWMDELIEKEFAPFRQGIGLNAIRRVRHGNVIRLQVINNQVYQLNGTHGAGYAILDHLSQIYGLPDLDLLYCQHDVLWEEISGGAPILCPTKVKTYPHYIYFVEWWGPWWPHPYFDDNAAEVNEAVSKQSWEQKKDQLIWRGTTSDGTYSPSNWKERRQGYLCHLSLSFPYLIDARVHCVHEGHCYNDKDRKALLEVLPMSDRMSLTEQVAYKYQILLDGCCAAVNGDRWRFLSNSVVFKHESGYGNWFYDLLIPWVHYIPLKGDLSDLIPKLEYLLTHDDEARAIAAQAREFTLTHLMSEHLALYCYKVLLKYASLQRFQPKREVQ